MSIGCSRYFLRLPSRMSREMPVARPGMLENMRLTCTSSRYAIMRSREKPAIWRWPELVEVLGHSLGELQLEQLGAAELLGDAGERPVVEQLAVRDDQHAPAQRLDVAHVMTRQQHGHAAAGVVLAQALLDRHLGDHV